MQDHKSNYLTGKIEAPARLLTNMRKISSRMSYYPAMEQVSDGTCLRYTIKDNTMDKFYTLEIRPNRITLLMNSLSSPSYFQKEMALRFITISMALCEDYSIDLYYLLPCLINVLAGPNPERSTPKAAFNRDADILLSKRVVELVKLNKDISAKTNELNRSRSSLLAAVITCRYAGTFTLDRIVSELDVSMELVLAAIELLRNMGYTILTHSSGNYELISP